MPPWTACLLQQQRTEGGAAILFRLPRRPERRARLGHRLGDATLAALACEIEGAEAMASIQAIHLRRLRDRRGRGVCLRLCLAFACACLFACSDHPAQAGTSGHGLDAALADNVGGADAQDLLDIDGDAGASADTPVGELSADGGDVTGGSDADGEADGTADGTALADANGEVDGGGAALDGGGPELGPDDGDSSGADGSDSGGDETADSDAATTDQGGICQSTITTIADMPFGSAAVDFQSCAGCACCGPGGSYPTNFTLECLTCTPAGALTQAGATLQGGQLTTLVGCVTGNPAAPMADRALFVGGAWQTPSGKPGLELLLNPPARMFGFSAVPTASDAKPLVVLRGYDAAGIQVAEDSFDFVTAPGGACATVNPAAQFFGFRPCSEAKMARVVVEVSDANVAIDEVRIWAP